MAWDELKGYYLEHEASNGRTFPLSNRRAAVEEASAILILFLFFGIWCMQLFSGVYFCCAFALVFR